MERCSPWLGPVPVTSSALLKGDQTQTVPAQAQEWHDRGGGTTTCRWEPSIRSTTRPLAFPYATNFPLGDTGLRSPNWSEFCARTRTTDPLGFITASRACDQALGDRLWTRNVLSGGGGTAWLEALELAAPTKTAAPTPATHRNVMSAVCQPSQRSASRSPTAGANLKPWPEHAEPITV